MNIDLIWSFDNATEDSRFGRIFSAYTTLINDIIYIHGGALLSKHGRKLKVQNDLWRIQILPSNLTNITLVPQNGSIPCCRFKHHICNLNGKLYLFGGQTEIGNTIAFSDMFKFHTGLSKWKELRVTGNIPRALNSSSAVIDQIIYVFGGIQLGEVCNDLTCFDKTTKSWQLLKSTGKVPAPRCDHAVASVGASMFLFGGSGGYEIFYSDMYALDTDTLQWTYIKSSGIYPIPRAGHTLIAHHKKDLYVFGGYNDQIFPDGGPISEDILKYSIAKNRWKTQKSLGRTPEITYNHVSWIKRNHIYIFGGAGLDGGVCKIRVARILNPSEREDELWRENFRKLFLTQK